MATSNGRFEGVLVRGMRAEDIRANRTVTSNVLAGDIRAITPGSNKVAIGSRLADTLGLYRGGADHRVESRRARRPCSAPCRARSTYTVGAVIEIGVYEYDKAYVVMPIQDAQHSAADGRSGRDDRDPDRQPRQGAADPRAAAAARAGPSGHHRLAADELGFVLRAPGRTGGDVHRRSRSSSSSPRSTSSPR